VRQRTWSSLWRRVTWLTASTSLLLSGCGLAHSRQVAYPNGAGGEPALQARRGPQPGAPVVRLRVDDQGKAFPSMLGD
jgi:hypothetical protein